MTYSSVLELLRGEPFGPVSSASHETRRGRPRLLASLDRPDPNSRLLHAESTWRRPEVLQSTALRNTRLVASRWFGTDHHEHASQMPDDYHMLAVTAQPSRFSLWLGGKFFPHRDVIPGTIQISSPAQQARIVYAHPYDVLHLHSLNSLLMEYFEWAHGRWPASEVVLRDPLFAHDALLQELGTTLLSVAERDDSSGALFADFLNLAIVARLLGRYGDSAPSAPRKAYGLPGWRLKRAVEFIDAHLGSRVMLSDLAEAVGMSRMHFASQSRAATGLRPHEYMLRRRIEKAQLMLSTTDIPIAELALTVGFSSQAHFTTVFKRFSGLTPNRWRHSQRL